MPVNDELDDEVDDERMDAEVADAIAAMKRRYRTLFGEDPSGQDSIEKIREQIRLEMIRRDLRPYKL